MTSAPLPFWQTKTLTEMSAQEWESLCDGCGKCCLHKLEDEDTGHIHLTMVACRLLDLDSCRCAHYAERQTLVPACVRVRPDNLEALGLPSSCSYRLIAEGRELPTWHHLVSGDRDAIHAAGASVQRWAISERDVAEPEDLEDYVVAETSE